MGHYSIDVDVDQLTTAKAGLVALADHLTTHSEQASSAPGEIGAAWTGSAATAVKTEMTGLGDEAKQFAPKFTEAAEAIGVFVTACQAAQHTVDSLNRQYDSANRAATDAITRAQNAHDTTVGGLPADDTTSRTTADSDLGAARGQAASTLRYTLQAIDFGYDEAVTTLRTAATALGRALHSAVVIAVSDETVSACERGPLSADMMSQLRRAGVDALAGDLHLTHDRQSVGDGQSAAAAFHDWSKSGPHTKAEIDAMLGRLHLGDEAFRQGFLDDMDPKDLVFLQEVAHNAASSQDNAKDYGRLITAISQMMAQGSKTTTQGTYPVRADFYDDWQQAEQDWDRGDTGKAELFIAEIVQAGQGEGATWDTAIVTQITRDTIAFERKKQETDPTFSWGSVMRGAFADMPTQAARDMGGRSGNADALAMLFDALSGDPQAAQDVLLDDKHLVDKNLLHYLYGGRTATGNGVMWGEFLGQELEAATSFVGPGGEGTQNYASADIVSDMVHWFGTNMDSYSMTMDQHVVNILSHHIQAVNYAGSTAEGSVAGNRPGLLQYQQIALANLAPGDLANLLKGVFGEDYYAQHGDSADPSKGFPMYQQLSAAQHAAFRRDFLDIANGQPLDRGRLEQLAKQQSYAETNMAHDLRDALTAQGASADEAEADAKAAVDFVLGLGIDKLPVDKLGGTGGMLAGEAIDNIKEGALSKLFPDRDLAGQANAQGLSVQDYLKKVVPLEYVNMLDESGVLHGDRSPVAFALSHPTSSSFVENGHLVDLADLYAHRADPARQEQWNQFLFYYQEQGQSALNDLDLSEQFDLGFLTSDDEHGGSGG